MLTMRLVKKISQRKKFKPGGKTKEIFFLLFFIILFIFLRSINFIYYLTFIGWDQAEHAILALDVFRNHKLMLIGPRVSSLTYEGRQIFIGPFMTYLMTVFLFFGGWDPAKASYLFMLFCGLMTIPLYYGIKWLIGKREAWLMVIVYTLLPYYLNYTRFLWNPNFQFSLLPILFLLMGLYEWQKKPFWLLAVGFFLGLLLQLHYQFILSIFLLALYYLFFKKIGPKKIFLFGVGLVIGFSPIIFFELRHQFYLTKTLWIFFEHRNELEVMGENNHYYLCQSFVLLSGLLMVFKNKIDKLKTFTIRIFFVFLFLFLLVLTSRQTLIRPKSAFWAPVDNWNYLDEVRIYELVKAQNLKNFNITNQTYDSKAMLQKYFLLRDGINIDDEYYHNRYLFVVDKTGKKNFMDNPGYEVMFFRPYRILKTWSINKYYSLHLVERR